VRRDRSHAHANGDDGSDALFDEDVLDRLQELFEGDDTGMNKFITEVLEDGSGVLAGLSRAVQDANALMVREQGHALKGIVSLVGATRLASVCNRLEMRGASGNLDGATDDLSQIEDEYGSMAVALKERFPAPGGQA
jgi:HPt (histidine-containing phosphotransfer) domain-containing protein